MDTEERAAVPTAEDSQVQPLLESPEQNDGATVTTTADAPPGYTEVVKGQKPVEIQLPGQPQLMFVQAGPHAQPGTFIQPVQYMVPGVPANTNDKYRASHDFLIVSAITSVLCGILNILTLACTIPAVVLAYQSRNYRLKEQYRTANNYSNCALAFTITAIISGLLIICLAVGIMLGLYYHACGTFPLTVQQCPWV